MKRFLIPGAIGVAVLGATGFTIAELSEYGQVVRNQVQSTIQNSVPIEVELQRLEVLLDKVDAKTRDQKRIVAKAQIELEDAETLLAETCKRQAAIKSAMASVRNSDDTYVATTTSGTRCGGVQAGASKDEQLVRLLVSYKTQSHTVAAREKAVAAHRHAVESLTTRFQEWSQERQTLRQQLDALRARHAATQIAAVGQPELATSDLNRASELFNRLDQRLKIEERVSEDLDSLTIPRPDQALDSSSVTNEVDQILGSAAQSDPAT